MEVACSAEEEVVREEVDGKTGKVVQRSVVVKDRVKVSLIFPSTFSPLRMLEKGPRSSNADAFSPSRRVVSPSLLQFFPLDQPDPSRDVYVYADDSSSPPPPSSSAPFQLDVDRLKLEQGHDCPELEL